MTRKMRNWTDNIGYRSVNSLFFEKTEECFEIPAYQRHYTWGTSHILELITDICTHMRSPEKKSPYHLGSLVLAESGSSGKFEIVDGQQRCLTIWLILNALKQRPDPQKLTFSQTRECATKFFEWIQNEKKESPTIFTDSSTKTLFEAYSYLKNFFENDEVFQNKIDSKKITINEFKNFLLEKTFFLKTVLPPNTDVSLYFERMNDRGEQMEATDIVKARLFQKFSSNKNQPLANEIWNACSNMTRFIQSNFSADPKQEKKYLISRETLFSDEWCEFKPENISWDEYSTNLKDDQYFGKNMKDYLEAKGINSNSEHQYNTEFFTPVTDFPHLLLHALNIFNKSEVIALNSNELVKIFEEKTANWTDLEVKKFLITLLKCRFLLDTFIIKSMNSKEESWDLWRFDKKSDYCLVFNSTQSNYKKIKLLQAAFHCSFPNRNYKNWLDCVLRWLDQHVDDIQIKNFKLKNEMSEGTNEDIFVKEYYDYLRSLAFLFFASTDNPGEHMENLKNWSSGDSLKFDIHVPDIDTSFKYLSITVYKLNYIEYLIYEKYLESQNSVFKNFFDIPNLTFDLVNFRYSTSRTSIDHFVPQNPPENSLKLKKLHDNLVENGCMDGLVNLSLMSPNQNSKHLNHDPLNKTDVITEQNSSELPYSLKTQLLANKILELKKSDIDKCWKDIPEAWKSLQHQLIDLLMNDFDYQKKRISQKYLSNSTVEEI